MRKKMTKNELNARWRNFVLKIALPPAILDKCIILAIDYISSKKKVFLVNQQPQKLKDKKKK